MRDGKLLLAIHQNDIDLNQSFSKFKIAKLYIPPTSLTQAGSAHCHLTLMRPSVKTT